jgi:hypothetical protein
MGRLRSWAFRIYGEPPAKDAPRSAMLRWIRGFYIKPLPLVVATWVLVLIWARGTWTLVLLAISATVWLQGFVSLSLRIRREERREA